MRYPPFEKVRNIHRGEGETKWFEGLQLIMAIGPKHPLTGENIDFKLVSYVDSETTLEKRRVKNLDYIGER